jgi:hypothetical protein
MAARQFEQSRCFFAKATQLDKHHAHSWIAFGHAFAEQVSFPTRFLIANPVSTHAWAGWKDTIAEQAGSLVRAHPWIAVLDA